MNVFRIIGSSLHEMNTRAGRAAQRGKLLIVNCLFHALAIFCLPPHEMYVYKCLLKLELEMFHDSSDLDIRDHVTCILNSHWLRVIT